MSRKGPISTRAPARVAEPTALPPKPMVDREGSVVALRLAIGKDGLGIELAERATVACFDVVELVVRLPNVRFPFDVTGGVARFRHRRGELERIALELDARRAARWAEPRLHGLIDPAPCSVTIAPRAFGATVTILVPRSSSSGGEPAALAFEVAIFAAPDVALVVHSARGANLPLPATLLALRAMATLLGDSAKREGSRFLVPHAAARIARALLPDAGVRAPGGDDVLFAGSGESDGVLFAVFTREPAATAIPQVVTLANEAALLARGSDDARFSGDLERARRLDVTALERAPRHAEIARRIAEIDAHVGGRAEAASATLRAADRVSCLGRLLGDLLVEAGDPTGAIAALLREGEREPSGAVAALSYARAATLAQNPADALDWLDAAVGRAPNLAELRWERATRRLTHGRLAAARADFQELEAMSTGPHERHGVLRRAADIHRSRGLGEGAAILYERALLYRPDDPDAVAGLGAAIAAEGRAARGATLLARAIDLANERTNAAKTAWMELELGRVLGDRLGDRPAAIARLRAIRDDEHEAIDARGLEGRYRAALGDIAGASLAYARLRERAGSELAAVAWLDEAATFEQQRGELAIAQAHLAAAVAIGARHQIPNDAVDARYRDICERLARTAGITPDVVVPSTTTQAEPPGSAPPDADVPTPEEDEARVEALTRTLQGDPTNDAVVDDLAVRLTRLGRSMDLLALLSARIEDAPPERREELLPRHRAVLERLEQEARAAGRDGEADLFRMARDAS